MKPLQEYLTQHAFENENVIYQSDEDLVTYIRDTKKAVRDWLAERRKNIQDTHGEYLKPWELAVIDSLLEELPVVVDGESKQ